MKVIQYYKQRNYRAAFLICTLILSTSLVSAQSFRVFGKVFDKSSGETLPLANVFLANTTFGSATDMAGAYEFNVTQEGAYKLTVRYLGYDTHQQEIELNDNDELEINIYLNQSTENVAGVEVKSNIIRRGRGYYETEEAFYIEEKGPMWRNYYSTFETTFLGKGMIASKAKIKNPDVLTFEFQKKDSVFLAMASEPLIIENEDLGYIMEYTLEDYSVNIKTRIMSFHGYPFFKQMRATNRKQYSKWKRNRWEVYRGSLTHFLRSLHANNLKGTGFETRRMSYNSGTASNDEELYLAEESYPVDLFDELDDGSHYRSKQFKMTNAFLLITAANSIEEEGYQRSGWHKYLFSNDFDSNRKNLQRSWLKIEMGKSLEFAANGYVYNPLDFAVYGYWSFKMVGDMLPIEYEPDEIHRN